MLKGEERPADLGRTLKSLDSKINGIDSRLQQLENTVSANDQSRIESKLDEVVDEMRSSKSDVKAIQGGLRDLMSVLIVSDGEGKSDVGASGRV